MRAFVMGCLAAAIIAASAAFILDSFVQKPSSTAYSTSGARI